ncbi:MAG: hypothetical protein L6Q76_23065 [Polyangiaceae bacterium]|nr:hypothetical protein [Polyangiaceae bacterium]
MTPKPTERPRLLIVAGPNGAGKTTITDAGWGILLMLGGAGSCSSDDAPGGRAPRASRGNRD